MSVQVADIDPFRFEVTNRTEVGHPPESGRVLLDMPITDLRRVRFDIERRRPATLVIVPESTHHEAQVLEIGPEAYDDPGKGLGYIGGLLHDLGDGN